MSESYIPRIADAELQELLEVFGGVLVEGPKWCGKTTTAAAKSASSILLMDPRNDFAARSLAQIDPDLAIQGKVPRLIDEWQEVPKLWDAVRYECDQRAATGQFILTGSATPRDSDMPMHSGAGRIARMRMDTMTLQELGVSSGEVSLAGLFAGAPYRGLGSLTLVDIASLIVRGGWPAAVGKGDRAAARMASEYIKAVVEVDASEIDKVPRDPVKLRRLIESLARNESTLASNNALVKDMNGDCDDAVSRQTVATYLSVLARLHVTNDVPAWSPALRSPVKLRSTAKRHLADVSLAAAALGADASALLDDPKTLGLLFESLVIHDLMAYARPLGAEVYHYHDADDLEADCIVAKPGGAWSAFEVKLGPSEVPAGVKSLLAVRDKIVRAGDQGPAALCVVVGFGMPAHVTEEGVQIIPVDMLGV